MDIETLRHIAKDIAQEQLEALFRLTIIEHLEAQENTNWDEETINTLHHLIVNAEINIPQNKENTALTTPQAATLLGISRPTLMRLIRENKIPSHASGPHTRLWKKDVMEFKKTKDQRQREALQDLLELEDELGL